MRYPWLAYPLLGLLGLISFAVGCKGGGGSSSSFLEVVATAPDPGEDNVQVEARIFVRVSEPIDPSTLTTETFFLTGEDGAVVPSTVSIFDEPDAEPSEIGTVAALRPEMPLSVLTNFTATVTTGLASTGGRSLEEDFDWSFMTIDAEWGESEWIEPLAEWSSSGPKIALDEQLNAIAVWQLEDQGQTGLFANRYTRVDLWGEPQPIDDGNGGSANPSLAVDADGNGFAVWERQDEATERNIWANRYDVTEASWGSAALLQNGDVTRARSPAVAASATGEATAVWAQVDLDTGREIIRAIRYQPDGGWGDSTTIAVPTTFSAGGRTAVGMDDQGNAIAVWDPPAGPAGQGGRVIWVNRFVAGSGWGEATAIKSDETTSADNFRLDVGPNGDAVVVWVQDNGDDLQPRNDIWAARFSEGTWSAPERIDSHDDGNKATPDVAVEATGIAYAVWSQSDPDFVNIHVAQYTPGSGWEAPELIEPPNEDPNDDGDATTPRIDVNRAGNAFVVWRQVWDQWPSIWSNRLDPGTSWMMAERIEEIPQPANQPVIAVDETRHAHALWVHSHNSGPKVRTNRFE